MDYPLLCIIEAIQSERDRNGNTYTFVVFYSPARGRHDRLVMADESESNAVRLATAVLGHNYEFTLSIARTVPKKQFRELERIYKAKWVHPTEQIAALATFLNVPVPTEKP